jgi:MFS superfamily sulfate permease-like transporter
MKNLFKTAGADLSASVVVFLVALPLCLGIALGSGAPLFSGIIAGIVGGIVVGSLSGSHLSVSGPAAGLTAIVVVAIGKLPSFDAFLLSVVLAGGFQLLFGFLRAGVFGDYVPTAVIKGMLSAIGIILILKQIPHLVGFDADYQGDYTFAQANHDNTFSAIFQAFDKLTPLAVVIGVISLILYIVWEKVLAPRSKVFQLVPAPLVVVVAGVLLNKFLSAGTFSPLQQDHLVSIPVAENVQGFLSFLTFPSPEHISLPLVWTTALTIAIVASLESLLNIEAADELDPYKRVTPTNRELKAQGIGNIVSGMIGGLPVTSVVVRTSANVNSGAKTKLSTIMHGLWLLLFVALIPSVLNLIPLSALAAILIYTGYKLAKPSIFKELYRKGYDQFLPFLITVIAIIFTDLLIGIIIGIGVGLFFVLRSNFKSSLLVVHDDNKYLFRFRKDVSFLNKPLLKTKLEKVPDNSYVIIDVMRADFIDKDVIEVINDFLQHAHLKNIRVEIKSNATKSSHSAIESQHFPVSVSSLKTTEEYAAI